MNDIICELLPFYFLYYYLYAFSLRLSKKVCFQHLCDQIPHTVFNKTRPCFSNIEIAETAQYNVPLQPLKPIIRKETAHALHFRWGLEKLANFLDPFVAPLNNGE